MYTIGQVSKMFDLSISTLRYYDKEGLLPFLERSNSGIRMFSDKDYEWLKIIECLKKSGLSIKEIRSYIDMTKRGDDSLEERLQLFEERKKRCRKTNERTSRNAGFIKIQMLVLWNGDPGSKWRKSSFIKCWRITGRI